MKNHTFLRMFVVLMTMFILIVFLCLSFTKTESTRNGKTETYWEFNGKRVWNFQWRFFFYRCFAARNICSWLGRVRFCSLRGNMKDFIDGIRASWEENGGDFDGLCFCLGAVFFSLLIVYCDEAHKNGFKGSLKRFFKNFFNWQSLLRMLQYNKLKEPYWLLLSYSIKT